MNKLYTKCLILLVCIAMLLAVGCAKKEDGGTNSPTDPTTGEDNKDNPQPEPKEYTVDVTINNESTTGVTAESIKYIIGTDTTKKLEEAQIKTVSGKKVATIAVPAGEQVIIVFSGTGLDIEKDTQNKHKVEWKVNSVVAQDTDVKETKKTATPAVDAKSELTIKKVEAKKDVTVTVTKNS